MALIDLVDNLSQLIDKNEYTIGIFVDLAFDTVDHKILIRKLSHYGIRGIPLMWFEDYLSNRKQSVKSNDTISTEPLLFLLYINDIDNSSTLFNFILFADDTSMCYSDRDFSNLIQKVNCELNMLSDWFKANKLSLNIKKTVLLSAKDKSIANQSDSIVFIDSITINRLATTKFLGTYINEHLDWKPHISQVAIKMEKIYRDYKQSQI